MVQSLMEVCSFLNVFNLFKVLLMLFDGADHSVVLCFCDSFMFFFRNRLTLFHVDLFVVTNYRTTVKVDFCYDELFFTMLWGFQF